jgi:uncharacterized protein YoxC
MPAPQKNVAFTFDIALIDADNRPNFKANPTIATGDFKVSIDNGSLANLGTDPVVAPSSSRIVKVVMAQAEMNGDRIAIVGVDASGAEWDDVMITINTTASTIDTIKAETALIVADTNELQGDDVPGLIATLDAVVDTVKVDTAAILVDTNELQGDDVPGLISTLDAVVDTVKVDTAAILVDTNELQGDWVNGGRLDLILDAILVDTGTTLQGELDGIQADTEDLQTQIGTAGAGLTDLGGMSSTMKAQINTEVDGSMVTYGLDHLLAASVAGSDVTDNSIIAKLVDDASTADWDNYDPTTASLEALNVDTDAIKAETALIVEDTNELQGDDVPGLISTLDAVVDTVKVDTAATLVDTNELQGDWTNGGRLDLIVDAILVDTGTTLQAELDGIQADTEDLQAQIGTAGAGLTGLGGMSSTMKAQINTEADAAIVTYKLDHLVAAADGDDPVDGSIMAHLVSTGEDWSTFVPATDSLQAIRDRGDAEWTTGAGGTPPTTLQNTTIASLASQTSFTLSAGSADNAAYVGAMAIVTDASTATQKAVGLIKTYTGSSKTVVLDADPGVFTMANGDTVDIVATSRALPEFSPDAAGGLIVSDAGGLDADTLNSNVTAILADTNELQGDDVPGLISTLDAVVDTVKVDTAAILVDTGTTIPGTITTAQNDLDTITGSDGATLATLQGNYAPSKGIRKNTALSNFSFVMYDSTDHVTPKTGRTVTGTRSLNAGSFASITGTFTEIANGAYQLDSSTADTNADWVIWRFTASGADDVFVSFGTVA